MKSQHTNGEFKAVGTIVKAFKPDSTMLIVADCYVSSYKNSSTLSLIEAEANAKLIAAAPELLEACFAAISIGAIQFGTSVFEIQVKKQLESAYKKATT